MTPSSIHATPAERGARGAMVFQAAVKVFTSSGKRPGALGLGGVDAHRGKNVPRANPLTGKALWALSALCPEKHEVAQGSRAQYFGGDCDLVFIVIECPQQPQQPQTHTGRAFSAVDVEWTCGHLECAPVWASAEGENNDVE